MKQIKVKEQEFSIPENWVDVKLKDYIKITTTLQQSVAEGKGNMSIIVDILHSLYNISKKEIYELDSDTFNDIISCFLFINQPITDKVNEEFIELSGKKYKFKTEFNKLSVGEMISYELLVQNSKDLYTEFDKILAILMREINEDGTLKEFDADLIPTYLEILQDVSISDIYGLTLFFSNGVANFMKGTVPSSL